MAHGLYVLAVCGVVAMAFGAVPKEKSTDEEFVEVTAVGTIHAGLVAIGGETTGTVIKAENISLELDFGDRQQLLRTAEELDGKKARVHGRLELRQGVEVKDRWIVNVETIKAVE